MSGQTRWYGGKPPDIAGKLEELFRGSGKDGLTDRKSRELLMLALACIRRCSHCAQEHIQQALDLGATKDEVAEAVLVALYWVEQFSNRPACTDAEDARDRSTTGLPRREARNGRTPPSDELPPGYLIQANGCVI